MIDITRSKTVLLFGIRRQLLILVLLISLPCRAYAWQPGFWGNLADSLCITTIMTCYYTIPRMLQGNPEDSVWDRLKNADSYTLKVLGTRIAAYSAINLGEMYVTNGNLPAALQNRGITVAVFREGVGWVKSGVDLLTYFYAGYDKNVLGRFNEAARKWDLLGEQASWWDAIFFMQNEELYSRSDTANMNDTVVGHSAGGTIAGVSVVALDLAVTLGPKRWLGVGLGARMGGLQRDLGIHPTQLADTINAVSGIHPAAGYVLGRYGIQAPIFIVSVSSLGQGFIPTPGDLRFARFPNCDLCWYGTNLSGKDGPLLGALTLSQPQSRVPLPIPEEEVHREFQNITPYWRSEL